MSTHAPLAKQFSDAEVLSAFVVGQSPGRLEIRESWGQMMSGSPPDFGFPFLAGSQAKMYTAACVALLVKSRAVAVDEPVRRHVSACPDGIDVLALLTHTSGLGDHVVALLQANRDAAPGISSSSDLVALAQRAAATHGRGTFAYSNTGYLLLALLVEHVSGEPLATFAARRIFEPLGMHHTRFIDGETRSAWPLLQRLDQRLSADGCARMGAFQLLALAHGSGNLITTLDDCILFGRALTAGAERFELQLPDLQDRGLELVSVNERQVWGHRAHFLAVSSGTLIEPGAGSVAAYVVYHRCRPDLKPSRALLLTCELLAERAFGDEEPS